MTAAADVDSPVREAFDGREAGPPGMPLAHYLQLIRFKVTTELRSETERTYVGFAWWIIDPVVSMAVYYLVFALLFHRGGPDFVPFLFIGLLTFRWLNTCVCHGAVSILQENGLMQQVYLPKVLFPIVSVMVDTVKFACAFGLLIGFLVAFGYPVASSWLALPVVLFVEFLLILGVSCLLAAATPFVPDLDVMLGHLFRMLFFVSGVFYAIDSVPEQYHFYLRLNPMASLIEAYRAILLGGAQPSWVALTWIGSAALGMLSIGYAVIRHFDRQYPKLR